MSEQRYQTPRFLQQRCPCCSAKLLTDGELVWCTLLDGNNNVACEFGHERDISIDILKDYNIEMKLEA